MHKIYFLWEVLRRIRFQANKKINTFLEFKSQILLSEAVESESVDVIIIVITFIKQ